MDKNTDLKNKILTEEDMRFLLEKYYDGETSCEEEKIIRRYLNADNRKESEFIPDKEVQGYISVYGKYKKKRSLNHRIRQIGSIGVAAAVIAIFFSVVQFSGNEEYIMYAHGKKIKDKEMAFNQMHTIFSEFDIEDSDFETQLTDIFNQ